MTARRLAPVAALGAWVGVIVVSHVWGEFLLHRGHQLLLGAPPLFGRFETHLGWRVLPALVVAAVAVGVAPAAAVSWPWRRLLVAVVLATVMWAVALAFVDGVKGITGPLTPSFEYLHDVPRIGSPGSFVSHHSERLVDFSIQTQGHPPGMVLVLWSLDRLGLGGPGWAAAVIIGVAAMAGPAALAALREVAGEARARQAAPFLAISPAAVWMATSADALFAGVGAVGIALLVASSGRRGRASDAMALGGGLLCGAALFLTYGAVLLGLVPTVVLLTRRRWRPLVLGSTAVAMVVVAFLAAGFWWYSGLRATGRLYHLGIASTRPYTYFLVANLAAFGLAVGPATAVALAWLRDRPTWLLVGAGAAAVVMADLSGLSKAEVERIWLIFVPWVLLATAAIRRPRPWLAAQALTGVAIQVVVRSLW